jgi:hypothetical protein
LVDLLVDAFVIVVVVVVVLLRVVQVEPELVQLVQQDFVDEF